MTALLPRPGLHGVAAVEMSADTISPVTAALRLRDRLAFILESVEGGARYGRYSMVGVRGRILSLEGGVASVLDRDYAEIDRFEAVQVALFLACLAMGAVVMANLGLLTVLRRRREIGLRRALGATGRGVSLQVLGELLVVTTAGLLLGAALAVQVPLLGVIGWVSNGVYVVAMALATLTIYGLTVVSALYPSWLATQVQPAEALHYE